MKSRSRSIILDGENLTVADIELLVNDSDATVKISKTAIERVNKAEKFLQNHSHGKIIYGVNTGFGPMASHIISDRQCKELQMNLVRSHAVGMGDPVDESFVLAAMVVRLNSLVKGYSGVSSELLFRLQQFINQRIIPIVPEHGAVGTSGDLVQLAHITLALTGEGEVFYQGKRQKTVAVMQRLKLKPYQLKIKEGLSLINGTAMMSGIASLLCARVDRLISLEIRNSALSLEVVNAFVDSIDPRLQRVRPHTGQKYIAEQLSEITKTSKLLRSRSILKQNKQDVDTVYDIGNVVQEVYSFRCIPQILGPVVDSLSLAKKVVETEINSATDNPLVDWQKGNFLHGGNFHGDYVAWAIDQLKMTITKLSMLSERRVNFLLNHKANKSFPPFLNLGKLGLNLGLQGLQFVATSTVAHNQTLSFPQYVHSIPTNADNQDVVSMGTDATLITDRVVQNAFLVATIELIVLAQAVDVKNIENKLSKQSKKVFSAVRGIVPKIVEDRVLYMELERLLDMVKNDSDFDFR